MDVDSEADPALFTTGTGEGDSRSKGELRGESKGEGKSPGRDVNEDAGEGHRDAPFE